MPVMRRHPIRILFTLAAAVSAVLCVALCVLWARSYRASDRVIWRGPRGWRAASSAQGRLEVSLLVADWSDHPELFHGPKYQSDAARPPFDYLRLLGGSAGDRDSSREYGGFAWHEKRNTPRGTLHAMGTAPFWGLALVTALLPLGRAVIWRRSVVRRRRGRRLGLCPACGYDLRATPGRCPECGKGMVAPAGAAGGAFRSDAALDGRRDGRRDGRAASRD